ncbi:MAG: hypothetical protein FWG66_00730 [Spirochaetes bacterium]|nr:hypothetical protein [Spirochaetota bacterium]
MSDLFDGIWDMVSGGQVSRNQMEQNKLYQLRERLEKAIKSYERWHKRGTVLARALYKITLMAFGEVCKLQDMIAHLSIAQRGIVEQKLQKKHYALQDIEKSLSYLKSHSASLSTERFAKNTLAGGLSILEKMPNKTGLATAGVYTLIEGLDHYASLNRQFSDLKAQQYEVLEKIDRIEDEVWKLRVQVRRADEMGLGLGKGISAFQYCYNDVYKKLFPNGDASKKERENRVATGGTYFLDNEKPEIESLLAAAGYVLKMVEAKP